MANYRHQAPGGTGGTHGDHPTRPHGKDRSRGVGAGLLLQDSPEVGDGLDH